MLARLAELDLLRRVRTLSCVSGGSIAGAIYYLTLLSKLEDEQQVVAEGFAGSLRRRPLTQEQVADCVRETHTHLQKAAHANIRALVFKNPAKNLLMYLSSGYSRTDRAGDMLDRHLYRRILQTEPRLWRAHKQLELRYLHVRHEHVPRLVLNATTLNSGHAWRFGTDGMGEQPQAERSELDKNDRFAFELYSKLPEHQANFPLGLAVAASACFPILFRPLPISNLYPGTRIDLMDGGAQDNQGIQALLAHAEEDGLGSIVVSDGAGQLEDERVKSRLAVSVIQRVIGVQADRIREEQLLAATQRLQQKLTIVDLRDRVVQRVLRPGDPDERRPPDIRESIARIRTDLDAFGPLESSLLVARGFSVASRLGGLETDDCPFLAPSARQELERPSARTCGILELARRQFLKPRLYWSGVALAALPIVALAGYGVHRAGPGGWPELGLWSLFLAFTLLPGALSRVLLAWVTWHSGRTRWLAAATLYVTLFLLAYLAGPRFDRQVGMSWSYAEVALLALGLFVLPALAPCLVWLLLSAEGRVWRRIAR